MPFHNVERVGMTMRNRYCLILLVSYLSIYIAGPVIGIV